MIPFFKHDLDNKRNYLKKTLNNIYLTSGPVCKRVENIIAKRFNKKNCILTNSWTNAVIAILKSINIKKQDEIIIPACTFVSCANVVEMLGGKVIFADIEKDTKLLCIKSVLNKITKNTKVIMPVHLYGNIFNTKELKKKIDNKNIFIIEDCAHIFSKYQNNKTLGYYSDFAVFSFYATKNVTCGEGGAIITNNNYANKIRSISNNGLSKPAFKRFESKKYIPWDVNEVGFKANLSDINASFLEPQIKKYDRLLIKRKKIYNTYVKYLSEIKEIFIPKSSTNKRDYHLFPVGVNKIYRNKLIQYLLENDIFVTVNYRSILNLYYYKKKYKSQLRNCPNSDEWGKETLSLPFHLKLSLNEIKKTREEIKNFFIKKNYLTIK